MTLRDSGAVYKCTDYYLLLLLTLDRLCAVFLYNTTNNDYAVCVLHIAEEVGFLGHVKHVVGEIKQVRSWLVTCFRSAFYRLRTRERKSATEHGA